jgi:hypothetical protein
MPCKNRQSKVFYADRAKAVELMFTIVDATPELTLANILCTLMRKKEGKTDPYFWTDKELIRKLQDMQADLFETPLDPIEEDI